MASGDFDFLGQILVASLIFYLVNSFQKSRRKGSTKGRRQATVPGIVLTPSQKDFSAVERELVDPTEAEPMTLSIAEESSEDYVDARAEREAKKVSVISTGENLSGWPYRSQTYPSKSAVADAGSEKNTLTVRQEQQSTDSLDSGYRSGSNLSVKTPIIRSEPLELSASTIRSKSLEFSVCEEIGPSGGTLAIAGSSLLIPPGALHTNEKITLTYFHQEAPFADDGWMSISPTISLQPTGLQFHRRVVTTLPAYFNPITPNEMCNVVIQTRQKESDKWKKYKTVKNSFPGKIVFDVDHFTLFRALVKTIEESLLCKRLYYRGLVKRYTLQDNPEARQIIWQLCSASPPCPDLMMAGMREHYEPVVPIGTLSIRRNQNVEIELTPQDPDVLAMPSICIVESRDIWGYATVQSLIFELHRSSNVTLGRIRFTFSMTIKAEGEDNHTTRKQGTSGFYWRDQQQPTGLTIMDSHVGHLEINPHA